MHIERIRARNFKALHDVTIHAAGRRVVIVGGKNAAGKSSVLDAVIAALAGKRAVPTEPVRRGEDSGEIEVEVGDFIVRRTFKADGRTALTVRSKDGAKYGQARLDAIFSDLGPDPLAFISAKPDAQIEIAKEALGLDFSDLDEAYERHFERRTEVNRTVARLGAELQGITFHNDAPEQEVSVSDLVARVQVVSEQLAEKSMLEQRAERHRATVADCKDRVAMLHKQIAELEQQVTSLEDQADKELQLAILDAASANQIVPDEDREELRRQITGAESINARVRENARGADLSTRLQAAKAESQSISDLLLDIVEARRTRIAEAKFPVEGLELSEIGIVLNGIPFDQASSAERLRVAVAMGLAMNPELRVFLVRDGSLLDEDSLRLFDEMAEQHDAQFWIERVGDHDPGAIVIEAGEVRGDE